MDITRCNTLIIIIYTNLLKQTQKKNNYKWWEFDTDSSVMNN